MRLSFRLGEDLDFNKSFKVLGMDTIQSHLHMSGKPNEIAGTLLTASAKGRPELINQGEVQKFWRKFKNLFKRYDMMVDLFERNHKPTTPLDVLGSYDFFGFKT